MYSLKLNGFKTQAQAQAFLDWYGGAGEQEAAEWFECRKDEGELDATFMSLKYADPEPKWEGNTLEAELEIFTGEEE